MLRHTASSDKDWVICHYPAFAFYVILVYYDTYNSPVETLVGNISKETLAMVQEANENPAVKPSFDTELHPEGIREFKDGTTLPDLARELEDGTLETTLPIPGDVSHIDPVTHNVAFDKVPTLDRSPTPVLAPSPEVSRKKRKGILMGVGSAAAGASLATAVFLGLNGGDKADTPRPIDATSAPAEPTPEAPTPTEAFDLFENNMLYPEGTAEEVLGNYNTLVSKIINARVDAGVPVPNNEDLRYLVNPVAAPGDLASFESFVQSMAARVVEARRLYEENDLDSNIDINVYSNFISSTPTPDGGFVIEAQDEYWAIASDGQQYGNITANLDTHIYTFSRADVPLPDGSFKNTLVLTTFETVQNTTTE